MRRIEPKTTLLPETTEPLAPEKLPEPRHKLRVRWGIRAGDPMAFAIKPYDA